MTEVEIKAAVRKRDKHRCTECGMTRAEHFAQYEKDLDVHRLNPGSEYTLEGCITVCRACHGPLPRRPTGTYPTDEIQARVPAELMKGVRSVAPVLGESPNGFVARAVRELLRREMPRAARELARRAQRTGEQEGGAE